MRKFVIALSVLAVIAAPTFGAKLLKKQVLGTTCTSNPAIDPVWSFKPDAAATGGNFELKWGKSNAVPGSTVLVPNTPVLVVMDLIASGSPNWTFGYSGCPYYFDPMGFHSFVWYTTNSNGNLKIPLNGPQIVATTYGQAAFQAFFQYTIDGGTTYEMVGSQLCTIYDKTLSGPTYLP